MYKAVQEIDDAKEDLMMTLKKFIKEGTPHRKSKSIDSSPIMMKSKKGGNNEVESADDLDDVFYDAVEDDDFTTPKHHDSLLVSEFSLKPKTNNNEVTLLINL